MNKNTIRIIMGMYLILLSVYPIFGAQWHQYKKQMSQNTYETLQKRMDDIEKALIMEGLRSEADRIDFDQSMNEYIEFTQAFKAEHLDSFQLMSMAISIISLLAGLFYFSSGILVLRDSHLAGKMILYALVIYLGRDVLFGIFAYNIVDSINIALGMIGHLGSYINSEIIVERFSIVQFIFQSNNLLKLVIYVIMFFILPGWFVKWIKLNQ